ncbi:hypothetical protein TNIN_100571, partial [Trichonephila inaurata madagascariensis]
MDQSNRKYWCESCNLQFKDYKQYLSHKYLQHDEQRHQPVIDNDGGEFQNFSNNLKTYSEMDIGKTFIKEQLNNNRKKDSEKGVFNHRFDFNGLEVLHSGKLTEKTVMPSRFINAVGYIQEPRNRYSISEFNIPFSSKYSQKENSWIEISPQAYTSEPLMSTERSPMEMYSHGMNEQFNRHQLPTSEYRQTQHFGNHEQINLNQTFRSSGIQQMIDINAQDKRNHFAESFEYSPMQLITHEMNPHFTTNQLTVSQEFAEMELGEQGTNPKSSANDRAFTDAHNSNSTAKEVSSPQHRRVSKIELNHQQYFKNSSSDINSIGRSTMIYKETINLDKACLDQRRMNITPLNEKELVALNNISASNSSLKKSCVPSEETSKKRESSGPSYINNMSPIRGHYDNKKTPKCGTVENKFGGNLNPNRHLHYDTEKNLKDCDTSNRFNQESNPMQNRAFLLKKR